MPPKFDPSLLPASPDLCLEIALWQAGVEVIAGIDEAGRGALAGPVAAAALILPSEPEVAGLLAGVRDSKQMTPDQRERWAQRLQTLALDWGLGFATSAEIADSTNRTDQGRRALPEHCRRFDPGEGGQGSPDV